eukprot:UN05451
MLNFLKGRVCALKYKSEDIQKSIGCIKKSYRMYQFLIRPILFLYIHLYISMM